MAVTAERMPLRRAMIVDAARELIIAGGLDSLSVRRLATRLGVTAPALYAHVTDKRDLIRAVAEAEFQRLADRFDALAEDDPIDRLRALGRAYVAHARENPELFPAMYVFPPDLGGVADLPDGAELPGATRAFAASFAEVERAIASGAIVASDPLVVALALWSGAYGVASVLQLGFSLPRELEDALANEVVERMLRGYGP